MDSLTPIYVSDPVLNKDGITSYTSYTLQGTRVPESLIRRYRDFDSLRSKLQERWPGIFIPNIPHKKTVGAKDKEVVDMRIEMINRFLNKISNIGYLFNSEEMDTFLQSTNDVAKNFDSLPKQSYEDLLKKYSMTFTEFDDNYDVLEGKGNQAKFMQTLKTSIQKIRHFRNIIEKAKKSYQATHESHLLLISMISLFEKEALKDYCQDNEDKLIFFNTKNVQLCKIISEVQENITNPYDKLYDAIAGDYLDTEALMEGIESINGLQAQYDGLLKKQNATATTLTEMQAGKTNIKSLFSFKSREQDIDAMMEEKQKLDTDIQNLGQIIRICCFNMDQEIKEFKTVNLESYYNELNKLEATMSQNNKILNGLWNAIINDQNIKAVNLEG
ncbi:MAG: hypothetical protein MJ252_27055 [archaeon]|nr:hypothetical protein [archaeon]